MAAKPDRKFTVLDSIIVIASIAIGLAWSRYYEVHANWEWHPVETDDRPFHQAVELIQWWVDGLSYCAALVTIALLIPRIWARPRKKVRYLTRLPGTVACGAILLTVSLDVSYAAMEFPSNLEDMSIYESFCQFTFLSLSDRNAGLAVAVAWTLLATSGRWRHEPGWLDDMGIMLGATWILRSLFSLFAEIVGHY